MPAFIEFLLVAFAIYLWESTLWLPLGGVALRKNPISGRWKALDPRSFFATRATGLIPMLPLPPDTGLAPCQSPPLAAARDGKWLLDSANGRVAITKPLAWEDFAEEPHHLRVAGIKLWIASHRWIGFMRRARQRGFTPDNTVRRMWRMAMSPHRAGREWRRWKLAAGPLHWYGLLLTLGFFLGLPAVYVFRGSIAALWFGLWLWVLMAATAAQLWWLAKRVYPDAKGALHMDALLALLVPFHAMRAFEIASVHAMATTHPAALLIWARDLKNPWLAEFTRKIILPSPGISGDVDFSESLLPLLTRALASRDAKPEDYNQAPDRADDHQANRFCPRCHALFTDQVSVCTDCADFPLRSF